LRACNCYVNEVRIHNDDVNKTTNGTANIDIETKVAATSTNFCSMNARK
jgi:hypothetical protein